MGGAHTKLGRLVLVERVALLRLAHRGEPQLDPGEILDQGPVVLSRMALAQTSEQGRVDLNAGRRSHNKQCKARALLRTSARGPESRGGYGGAMEHAGPVLPERIEGHGLLLRRWRVGDAGSLERAVSESADHLRPWMAWMVQEPQTTEDRRAMLAHWERDWSQGGDVMLGIFIEGEVAGSSGLHRRRGPGVLEIGYWIHRSFTRCGLATTVAQLLTDAAFSVPGIVGVEIHHDRANVVSAGVPRRLGFRFVGEAPDVAKAPAEVGIDCTWRMERAEWQRRGR
jgi:RimJ/RimL family protein N-acetyltransferase